MTPPERPGENDCKRAQAQVGLEPFNQSVNASRLEQMR